MEFGPSESVFENFEYSPLQKAINESLDRARQAETQLNGTEQRNMESARVQLIRELRAYWPVLDRIVHVAGSVYICDNDHVPVATIPCEDTSLISNGFDFIPNHIIDADGEVIAHQYKVVHDLVYFKDMNGHDMPVIAYVDGPDAALIEYPERQIDRIQRLRLTQAGILDEIDKRILGYGKVTEQLMALQTFQMPVDLSKEDDQQLCNDVTDYLATRLNFEEGTTYHVLIEGRVFVSDEQGEKEQERVPRPVSLPLEGLKVSWLLYEHDTHSTVAKYMLCLVSEDGEDQTGGYSVPLGNVLDIAEAPHNIPAE